MNVKYAVHFLEGSDKRIVMKEDQGVSIPYAFIMKDPDQGGYIVHNIVNGKLKRKDTYAQARRSACRLN